LFQASYWVARNDPQRDGGGGPAYLKTRESGLMDKHGKFEQNVDWETWAVMLFIRGEVIF
jgi:hypothetical protein